MASVRANRERDRDALRVGALVDGVEVIHFEGTADLVAGDVPAALGAEKLIHLTDVQGILDGDRKLVSTLARKDAERFVKDGVIDGGMLPKVESSLRALEGGTAKAHIIDGSRPHAIVLELFTREGIGTEIVL